MKVLDNPQVLSTKQGQGGAKAEVQEVSPLEKEVQASPSTPKRRKIKTPIKRRQKVIRKVIPFPSVPKNITKEEEEDDEDEEDNLPLSQRTHLSRATDLEQRIISTIIPPSIPT